MPQCGGNVRLDYSAYTGDGSSVTIIGFQGSKAKWVIRRSFVGFVPRCKNVTDQVHLPAIPCLTACTMHLNITHVICVCSRISQHTLGNDFLGANMGTGDRFRFCRMVSKCAPNNTMHQITVLESIFETLPHYRNSLYRLQKNLEDFLHRLKLPIVEENSLCLA